MPVKRPKTGNRPGRRVKQLTQQQAKFAEEYAVHGKPQTEAARLAGFKTPYVAAARLLNPQMYPQVVAYVRELQAARRKQLGIDSREVVEELYGIATFNLKNILDDDGRLVSLKDLPDDLARCVRKLKVRYEVRPGKDGQPVKVRVDEVEFWDKLEALKQLGQHLGLLKDQINIFNQVNVGVDWDALHAAAEKQRPDVVAQALDALPPPAQGATSEQPPSPPPDEPPPLES